MKLDVFIDRPILASVASMVIVVMGLLALQFLPVAQFPEINPAVMQTEADYPSANNKASSMERNDEDFFMNF